MDKENQQMNLDQIDANDCVENEEVVSFIFLLFNFNLWLID